MFDYIKRLISSIVLRKYLITEETVATYFDNTQKLAALEILEPAHKY